MPFCSALHGVYWFAAQTESPREPRERSRRVRREPPRILDDYRGPYELGMRARYRDGFRTRDSRRVHALALLGRLGQGLSSP